MLNNWKKIIRLKFVILGLLLFATIIFMEMPIVLSTSNYIAPLQSVYGVSSCGTCHIDPNGGARNAYGTLFENQPNHVIDPVAALQAIGAPGATPSPGPTQIQPAPANGAPIVNCYVITRSGAVIPGPVPTSTVPGPVPTSTVPGPVPTSTVPGPVPTSTVPLTVILEDHFQGTSLNTATWPNLYTGPGWLPSGNAGSYYRTENIIVNNGLHLLINRENYNGYSYTGGGLSTDIGITDGRIEVRARFPQSGQGVVGYLLLWPVDGSWPPELDFAETTGIDSNLITFTQHWGTSSSPQAKTNKLNIDVTQYHVYVADIINGQISWYVDGNLISTQTQNFNNKMKFAAGVWAGACDGSYGGCPSSATLPQYLDIDYVKMYQKV